MKGVEGFSVPVEKMRPTDEPNMEKNRTERIEQAEISVKSMFEEKLAGALDRIGKNPYFRDLEGNF